MDEDLRFKVICEFQKVVVEIYKEQKLQSLAGPERQFVVNDRQILPWFFNVVRKGRDVVFYVCSTKDNWAGFVPKASLRDNPYHLKFTAPCTNKPQAPG